MEAEAEADAKVLILLEAEAEAEAKLFILPEAEAEAEAKLFILPEAEAEAEAKENLPLPHPCLNHKRSPRVYYISLERGKIEER